MPGSLGEELSSNAVGFIGAVVAVVCFGCNLVPVKNTDTGDGMFYQWIMCSAIWTVGLVINLIRNCPTFYPLSMLGGFLWATGNITVVPILKTIGLGPGILIWSTVNMITGWASGHFGWFGLHPDAIPRQNLNYIGFALSLLRLVIFVGVKPDHARLQRNQSATATSNGRGDGHALLDEEQSAVNVTEDDVSVKPADYSSDASWVDGLSILQKRIIGIVLSLIGGAMYGLNFLPCIWIQENRAHEGASQNGLDYVFAHFCGIYMTSSAYFLIYSAYTQNRPQYTKGLVIPSLVSGWMWALAQAGWFVANSTLTESVSFPIVTTGPSIIAALWSVFYFREISGAKNYILLLVALVVGGAGVALVALSKI
ncbi:transmembrane protein 144-like [Diadema antillarum]|uniref:transmembrane protein 144-like n=1 Tax=Diadema antillarum TaxID=105358 RepID=UPI003A87CEBB